MKFAFRRRLDTLLVSCRVFPNILYRKEKMEKQNDTLYYSQRNYLELCG